MSQDFGPCLYKGCKKRASVILIRDDYFSKDWFGEVCEGCFDKLEGLITKK